VVHDAADPDQMMDVSAFGFAIFRLPFGFWISPCAFRLLVLASCLSAFGLSVYLIAY